MYETTTKEIYGIVLDDADDKMWWIENKGVANGLFNSAFDGGESNFIAYLEGGLVGWGVRVGGVVGLLCLGLYTGCTKGGAFRA